MSITNLVQSSSRVVSDFKTLLNGASVAVLTPKGTKGIAGWVFDIPTGENENLESDVTDHYTENNSFINDHIVNKPIEVMLKGLVGELVYRLPDGIIGGLRSISGRLAQVAALGGNYTPGFIQKTQGILGQAQVAINRVNTIVNQAQNSLKTIQSLFGPGLTQQKIAYNILSALWRQKTIFTVTTPWAYHDAMVIKTIGFSQDASSNDYTEITITLKEFRFAETKLTIYAGGDLSDPTSIQKTGTTPQGTAGQSNTTTLFDLSQSGGLKGKLSGFGS